MFPFLVYIDLANSYILPENIPREEQCYSNTFADVGCSFPFLISWPTIKKMTMKRLNWEELKYTNTMIQDKNF